MPVYMELTFQWGRNVINKNTSEVRNYTMRLRKKNSSIGNSNDKDPGAGARQHSSSSREAHCGWHWVRGGKRTPKVGCLVGRCKS